MASYNKVLLMGNLTRDPELRSTASGASICKLRLAVNRSYKGQDGSLVKETTFVDVDCFGRQADTIAKYFTKGRPIFVEGRLRLNEWESNTGEKQSRLVVVLDNFEFVGSRNDGGDEGAYPAAEPMGSYDSTSIPPVRTPVSKKETKETPPPSSSKDLDEDVPF